MFSFVTKSTGPDLDLIITRAMLALSALAVLVYKVDGATFLHYLLAGVLLTGAVFINAFVIKWKVKRLVLVIAAAIILFIATHSIAFALVLLAYGYLVKFLNHDPVININNDGIAIKRLFFSNNYPWTDFSNVVLKDNLLTLDFNNNKLIQVTIAPGQAPVDENEFNSFCQNKL